MLNNHKRTKRLLSAALAFLMLTLCLPVFSQTVAAAPTFSGIKMANTKLAVGESCNISGTVSTSNNAKVSKVTAYIRDANTDAYVDSSPQSGINVKSFDIKSSNVNKKLKFGNLKKGSYYLQIVAVDTNNVTSKSSKIYFSVGYSELKITDLTTSKYYIPFGTGCNITGKITSNYTINRVKAYIERDLGHDEICVPTDQSVDYNPKKKSINIVDEIINKNLKFGKLTIPGGYYVWVEAWDEQGNHVSKSTYCVVEGINIVGLKVGNNNVVNYGSPANILGTVWSNTTITKITAAVYDKNGKVVQYGDDYKTSWHERELKDTDTNKEVLFGKLAKGDYKLEVYVVDRSGHSQTKTVSFKVK